MMERVLQSIMVVSVLTSVSSQGTRQYHFIYERKNMTDALKYCREKYTDLATVDNLEDVKILYDMVDLSKMNNSNAAWIGMHDDVNNWRWSLADERFYNDGETEFRKWSKDEPNNYKLIGELCGEMYYTGYWNDADCKTSQAAVCVDARGPKVTFVLIHNMSWTAAQSYCRAHHTDLASVRNEAENQKIKALMTPVEYAWIGLFRFFWKWSDGSNSSFRYWKIGEPSPTIMKKACVVADFSQIGKWEARSCNETAAFICSQVITGTKQRIRVKLVKKDSSLDLNDPVVMERLLEQIKQRLTENGVTGDVKLSWKKQSDGKVFHKEKKTTKKDEL